MLANLDILLLIIYFVALLGIGFRASRKEGQEGFLIANRNVNAINLNATISASWSGGGVVAAYVALVYVHGTSAIWIWIGSCLGLLVFIPFAKKLKVSGDKEHHYTMLDFLYFKFGKRNNLISASLLFLMYLALVLVELIVGGKVFSVITNLPYWLAVLTCSATILFYLLLGGFQSVIRTDLFQYLLLFLFAIISWFLLTESSVDVSQLNPFSAGIVRIVSCIIMGIFITFVSADLWQRAYSAKNVKTLKKGFIFASISYLMIGLLVTVFGLVAKTNFPNISPNDAMIHTISQLLPDGLLGISLVALLSAVMSSADTGLFVGSLFFSRDFVAKYRKLRKEELIKLTRKTLVVLTAIATVLAIFLQDLVFVLFTMYSFSLILAPAAIGSFFSDLKRKAIEYSLVIGIGAAIVAVALQQVTAEMAIVPFILSAIVLVIAQKPAK